MDDASLGFYSSSQVLLVRKAADPRAHAQPPVPRRRKVHARLPVLPPPEGARGLTVALGQEQAARCRRAP